MELNRKAEVSIHAQAADIEFTLDRLGNDKWELHCKDTSGLPDKYPIKEQTTTLNNEQAAASMALFIVGDFENEKLNKMVWDVAEISLNNFPPNLLIIP